MTGAYGHCKGILARITIFWTARIMSQLLDRLRDQIRTLHDSIRTEDAHVPWARQFILFHDKAHPETMGEAEVSEFLTYLAVEQRRRVDPESGSQRTAVPLQECARPCPERGKGGHSGSGGRREPLRQSLAGHDPDAVERHEAGERDAVADAGE